MKRTITILAAVVFTANVLNTTRVAAQKIACGDFFSLAICNNGDLYGWGDNSYGQLGNGSPFITVAPPVKFISPSSISSVSSGMGHTLALKNDGTVLACGNNSHGQLGNGTIINDSVVPIQVNTLNNITAIRAANIHSIALKSDSTVWAWGYNELGQLGNGTNTDSHVPVQVTNLTGITSIAAGYKHSFASRKDGTVWTWGYNYFGQLGNGTNTDSNIPVQVMSLTGIKAVAGGNFHSMALKNDGTVWDWGTGTGGELGNGFNVHSNVPVQVSSLTGVTAIACGGYHSIALKNDGTVWAWGFNSYGQLGNGTNTDSNVPVKVSNLTGIVEIAAGFYHCIALKNDGTVWAWGMNGNYELGNTNSTNSNVPLRIMNLCGPSSVNDLSTSLLNINISPNPSNGKFQIKSSANKITNIIIYNMIGEKVAQKLNNNAEAQIDLSTQKAGIYFIEITDEQKNVINKKIIIE